MKQQIRSWANWLNKTPLEEKLKEYIKEGYIIENVIPITYQNSVGGKMTELKTATIILKTKE